MTKHTGLTLTDTSIDNLLYVFSFLAKVNGAGYHIHSEDVNGETFQVALSNNENMSRAVIQAAFRDKNIQGPLKVSVVPAAAL